MAYAAGAAGTALAPVAPVEIEYPSSDGAPLAESYFQLIPLFYAFDALRRHYAHRDDVFVAADMLIYYRRRTKKSVAPDVFVVFGAENRPRHSYLLWQEPKGPDFVLEVTSASTQGRQMEAAARRKAEAAQRRTEAARRQAEARVAALEALLRERGENDTPSG